MYTLNFPCFHDDTLDWPYTLQLAQKKRLSINIALILFLNNWMYNLIKCVILFIIVLFYIAFTQSFAFSLFKYGLEARRYPSLFWTKWTSETDLPQELGDPCSCDPLVQTDTCLWWSVIWPQASAGQLFIPPERMEGCLLLTERKIRNFCLSHLVQQINTTGNKGNFCDGLIVIHPGYQLSVKLVGLSELISLLVHTIRGFVLGRVHSISLLSLKQGQGALVRLSQSQSLWRT